MEEDIKIAEDWLESVDEVIKTTEQEQLKEYSIKVAGAFKRILAELENQKDYYETKLQEENQKYEELLHNFNKKRWEYGE